MIAKRRKPTANHRKFRKNDPAANSKTNFPYLAARKNWFGFICITRQ